MTEVSSEKVQTESDRRNELVKAHRENFFTMATAARVKMGLPLITREDIAHIVDPVSQLVAEQQILIERLGVQVTELQGKLAVMSDRLARLEPKARDNRGMVERHESLIQDLNKRLQTVECGR